MKGIQYGLGFHQATVTQSDGVGVKHQVSSFIDWTEAKGGDRMDLCFDSTEVLNFLEKKRFPDCRWRAMAIVSEQVIEH